MKKINKKTFRISEDSLQMTPGEMLETIRELQGLTQSKLAKMTGISQSNISALEKGTQQMGRDRVITLAKALKVHPAVIMFPNYHVEEAA